MYTDVYLKTWLHTPLYAPVVKAPSFEQSVLILSDF